MLYWFRSWDCEARKLVVTRLAKAERKVYQSSSRGGRKKKLSSLTLHLIQQSPKLR